MSVHVEEIALVTEKSIRCAILFPSVDQYIGVVNIKFEFRLLH